MSVGVEHDEREGQHVASVRGGENGRVAFAVPLGKRFHDPVNLLRLSREPESGQEHPCKVRERRGAPDGLIELELGKVEGVHELLENLKVEGLAEPYELTPNTHFSPRKSPTLVMLMLSVNRK